MTNSDSTVALDKIVARINIEHFCKRLSEEVDRQKRQTLLNLIAEETAKLSEQVHLARLAAHRADCFARLHGNAMDTWTSRGPPEEAPNDRRPEGWGFVTPMDKVQKRGR